METTNKRLNEIIKKLENSNIIIEQGDSNNINFNIGNNLCAIFDNKEYFSLLMNNLWICFDSLDEGVNSTIRLFDKNQELCGIIYTN